MFCLHALRVKHNPNAAGKLRDHNDGEPMNDDGAGEEGWQWPAALDALTAAPRHHTLLLENERVRVLDTHIAPGETVPLHTHRWPAVLHILSWGDFIRRDQNRNVTLDTRTLASPPASIVWSAPLPPHTLENVGTSEIRVITVELKDSPSQ